MGGGKIDLKSKGKRLDDAYPIDTLRGVYALFSHIHFVRESRFTRGDFDAVILLVDFEQSMEEAGLTERQRQVINLVFEQDLTQQEVAKTLNVSQQAVSDHVKSVINKVAAINNKKKEDVLRAS